MTRSRGHDESGAALVLALVFLLAIGLVLLAITNLAGGAATNTFNLRSIRTSELQAENVTTEAIAQARASASVCSSGGSVLYSGQVYCVQTTNSLALETRQVDFYACPAASAGSPCSVTGPGMLLHATVVYDDIPPDNPASPQCSGAATQTCGISVSIKTWDVRSADT